MFIYKTLGALLIFIAGLIPIIYPLRRMPTHGFVESFEIAEAFASGVFLGVAFFHMLPNAIHLFNTLYGIHAYPFAELICVSAFLFLIFLERLSYLNYAVKQDVAIPYLMTLILLIHSLVEGMALGIEMHEAEALIIFIAIFAHKACDSFALCVTLMRYHFSMRTIIWMLGFFALATPIGIALGTWLTSASESSAGQLLSAIFNAFAAGSFFYIATLHHIRFHHQHENEAPLLKFSGLLLGALAMGVIAIWV